MLLNELVKHEIGLVNIPLDINYLAQDDDGEVHGYIGIPVLQYGGNTYTTWCDSGGYDQFLVGTYPLADDFNQDYFIV